MLCSFLAFFVRFVACRAHVKSIRCERSMMLEEPCRAGSSLARWAEKAWLGRGSGSSDLGARSMREFAGDGDT